MSQDKENKLKKYKWQGPAFGARSEVRKKIAHRKQTEKQKIKMARMAPKLVPVIDLGIINLDSKFQLSSSSNHSDMDKYFSSNFGHQEGSGATSKYSVMLC